MSDRIEVSDPLSLAHLAGKFGSYSQAVSALCDEAISDARRRLASVERRGQELNWERDNALHDLLQVDDDDDDYYERSRLTDANDNCAFATQLQSEAMDAVRNLEKRLRMIQGQTAKNCHTASALYERKAEQVATYLAITPETGHVAPSGSEASQDGARESKELGAPPRVQEVQQAPVSHLKQRAAAASNAGLPKGFVWIELEEVGDQDFIHDPDQFRKVSRSKMERGLRLLESELLPLLADDPTLSEEDVMALDRERGTEFDENGFIHLDSLHAVWRAFLNPSSSAETIRIGGVHTDGSLQVTDGRHRLGVARELGITRLPGKFLVN